MGWYGGHMTGWGYLFMGTGTLVFWALVVAVAVLLLRDGRRPAARGSSPDQILAERFARGEIDPEEYRRRLDILHRS